MWWKFLADLEMWWLDQHLVESQSLVWLPRTIFLLLFTICITVCATLRAVIRRYREEQAERWR
jgi:heme/copper-type cytochrome/quinol oxidase subunit 2